MRIAFLTPEFPYPPRSAGQARSYQLIRQFSKHNEVEYFCLGSKDEIEPHDLSHMSDFATIHLIPKQKKSLTKKFWDFFIEPYHLKGFSRALLNRIIRSHEQKPFDVAHCESLNTALYSLGLHRTGLFTSLTHLNVETSLFAQLIKAYRNPFKRASLLLPQWRLRSIERQCLRSIDISFSYSPLDHQFFESLAHKHLFQTSHGCDVSLPLPAHQPKRRHLVFVGSLDYYPNHQGILWFLDNVFPHLPEFTLAIAGRSPRKELKQAVSRLGKKAELIEGPRDILPLVRQAEVEIVPVFIGSGVRAKILEGFALGKTIVSTTIGAEGIRAENGQNIIIANHVDEFVTEIRNASEHPQLRRQIGAQARKTAEQFYSWEKVAQNILDIYSTFVASSANRNRTLRAPR